MVVTVSLLYTPAMRYKPYIFPFIILVTALIVSGVAAYYSVFGLSKLFSGAAFAVIIMASSLEIAKIVIASLLQREWNNLHLLRRIYLTSAVFVLIVLTSAGIYGFLSNAYQITAMKDSILESRLNVLELKKARYIEERDAIKIEQQQIVSNITDLRKSLSNPNQIQYYDKNTKQLITTTSTGSRKALENQLEDATKRRDLLTTSLEAKSDSISYYEISIIESKSNSSVSSELGPLKYISKLTGKSMDVVVNWFLILIIFVFDPLAIVLITTANHLFTRNNSKTNNIKTETVEDTESTEVISSVVESTEIIPSVEATESIESVPVDTSSSSVFIDKTPEYEWVQNYGYYPTFTGSYFDTSSISDSVITSNDDIIVTKPDIPVIRVEQLTPPVSRHILDTDIPIVTADNIRKALPPTYSDDLLLDVSGSYDDEPVDGIADEYVEPTEREIQNMTHEQYKEHYRRKRNL